MSSKSNGCNHSRLKILLNEGSASEMLTTCNLWRISPIHGEDSPPTVLLQDNHENQIFIWQHKATIGDGFINKEVLAGHPDYEVKGGNITYKGLDLLEMEPEERAIIRLFISFQSPVETLGVSNIDFLNMAYNDKMRKLGLPELGPIEDYLEALTKHRSFDNPTQKEIVHLRVLSALFSSKTHQT